MKSPAPLGSLRQWYPLALVFLAMGLSLAMAYPFTALFLTTAVHADPVRVTIYLVAGPVAGVVFVQLIGRLSDRRALRRPLLIAAAAAGTVAMAVNAFVRDYWVLLGVAATLSAIAGSMMAQGFAYARAVLAGSDRAAMTTSTLRMLFSLAWVGGPPVAALIQTTGGFSALYATAAGMYAIAAIVVMTMLPEPTAIAANPVAATTPVAAPTPRQSARIIGGTIAAFALVQGAGSVAVQMLPLYLAADLHSGVRQAGLILGLCAALEIPLMLACGALSLRIPLRRLILLGPGFGVAYLVLASAATHSWVLFAGQLLNATSISIVHGLGVSYVQDLLPSQPGKASALYANSFTAGTILSGPLIAGAQTIGYRPAYLIAAGVSLIGFALIVVSRPTGAAAPQNHPAAEPIAA